MLSLKSILETSFSIHANPFGLQISKPLVTRGAGGRGEALRSAPTPQGYRACRWAEPWSRLLSDPQVLKVQGGSAPAAGPSQN